MEIKYFYTTNNYIYLLAQKNVVTFFWAPLLYSLEPIHPESARVICFINPTLEDLMYAALIDEPLYDAVSHVYVIAVALYLGITIPMNSYIYNDINVSKLGRTIKNLGII